MKVTYAIVPSGDMAGVLAYRVTADTNFDPDAALEQIRNHPSTQPTVAIIRYAGAEPNLIQTFCKAMKEQLTCTLVLDTDIETPTSLWYAVDRVVLTMHAASYSGTPANEVHLRWDSSIVGYPVVAPLGANQTHIYAYAAQDELDQLINWIRQAPYQIGIIRRPL